MRWSVHHLTVTKMEGSLKITASKRVQRSRRLGRFLFVLKLLSLEWFKQYSVWEGHHWIRKQTFDPQRQSAQLRGMFPVLPLLLPSKEIWITPSAGVSPDWTWGRFISKHFLTCTSIATGQKEKSKDWAKNSTYFIFYNAICYLTLFSLGLNSPCSWDCSEVKLINESQQWLPVWSSVMKELGITIDFNTLESS